MRRLAKSFCLVALAFAVCWCFIDGSEVAGGKDRVLEIAAELNKLLDEDADLVNVFDDSISLLQTTLGTTTGKVSSSSECIEAWLENTEAAIYNKCEETRKVTIKCQGRKGECVIPPKDTSERCGKCGAPTIIKDDFDDGGEG